MLRAITVSGYSFCLADYVAARRREAVHHINYLKTDPLFKRVVRLTRIPHRTKLSMALKQFTSDVLKALAELNSELVIEKLAELRLNELTIDLDGTIISTKGHPTWAFKGYNPVERRASRFWGF